MKSIIIVLILAYANLLTAQLLTKTREIYVNEKDLAEVAFIQADFDLDGKIDFLTDANKRQNFFIGNVEDGDILTLVQGPHFSINYDLLDIRYEDTDKDGILELYAFDRNEGLIQYTIPGLSHLQTIPSFKDYTSFKKMILADIDNDSINEWVLLDQFDGIIVMKAGTDDVITTYPSLTGNDLLIDNLDADPDLEIILRTNNSIVVIDAQTFSIEHTISLSYADQLIIADLDYDGLRELIITKGETLRIYHHESKAMIDSFTINLFSGIRDFVVVNIDTDSTQEIIGYTETFTRIMEFNIFPLRVTGQYEIQETRDLGRFIDYSESVPGELIFSFGNLGLAFFNPITRTVRFTYQTGAPHSLFIDQLGKSGEEYLITRPSGSFNPVINIKYPTTFKTFQQINNKDIFKPANSMLGSSINTFVQEGLSNRLLLFENGLGFSFYDFHTQLHNEFYRYQFAKLLLEDLDYDGGKEILIHSNNLIDVYSIEGDFNFKHMYSTIPLPSKFQVAQIDQTLIKEIISYSNNDVSIISGSDGSLIKQLSDLTAGSITDLTFYTDGEGNFYIVLIDASKVYVYDYTHNMLIKEFPYSSNGFQDGLVKVLQMNSSGIIQNFISVFNGSFQLFTTNGNLLFTDDDVNTKYNDKGQIIISDYNHDFDPEIIISTSAKFSEYVYAGPGDYHRSFYVTKIFPENLTVYNQASPFIIQFSEMVDLNSIHDHISISSKKQGNLSYTVTESGEQQITIHHSALMPVADTITIEITGELRSRLSKFLDTNYDDISVLSSEQPLTASYILNPDANSNTVEIQSIGLLPGKLYTQSERHLILNVSSQPEHSSIVSSAEFGMYFPEKKALSFIMPVDSVFDETSEEIRVPINTFGLEPGNYIFYSVVGNLQGNYSDTFFYQFNLIEEPDNYEKNTGGDRFRTSVVANDVITTNFKKIGEIPHGTYDYISHVVGGEDQMLYLERITPGNNGIIHNLRLPSLEPNWERIIPIAVEPGSPHLDNGIIYFSNAEDLTSEAFMMALDMHSGETISRKAFSSNGFTKASPISSDDYLAMPGGGGTFLFDRWTNKELWHAKGSGFNHRESNPAIYDRKLFTIDNKLIQAIDLKTGKLIWKIEVGEENPVFIANALVDTLNEQLLWTGEENIYAFDLNNGQLKWKRFTGSNRENLVLYNNEIFLFVGQIVYVHNATTGINKRQKNAGGYTWGQPVISNGKLFLPLNGRFEIWDAKTMAKLWSENITIDDISIIDEYLILTQGKTLHIYQSQDQCCNSSIEWTETIYGSDGSAYTERFTFDSIPVMLNGKYYFEILASANEQGGSWDRTYRYIRHEDSRIYEGNSNEEVVIMDFNLSVNDTFLYFGYAPMVVAAIDSIILENGEIRKRQALQCDVGGTITIYGIEGIGSTAGIFWGNGICAADGGSELLCLWQDGVLLYDNPDVNSCWLLLSTTDFEENNISVSPNPFHDVLAIHDPDQKIAQIVIYDNLGQSVYSGESLHIEAGHLTSGSYVLQAILNDGKRIVDKIIKY